MGLGVSLSPGLYVSSPMKEKSGYLSLRVVDTIFSTAWSVSVTRSAALGRVSLQLS